MFAREADESVGSPFGPDERRRYVLELNTWVTAGQLQLALTYSPEAHDAPTIERLADALAAELEAIVAHCAAPGAGGYTASDFPLAGLSAGALERLWLRFGRRVEDAYPLSPVQQGMLFHDQYAPASGAYCQQLVAELAGDVRPEMLARAFAAVLQRHPALRTAFVHGVDEPLQVVLEDVALPWEVLDAGPLEPLGQPGAFEELLECDRRRGFDLEQAPLLRLTLVRGSAGFRLVFTHHHLLLDGWSLAIVLGEILRAYDALLRGEPLASSRSRPYRDYIAWLAARDASSEAYWRETLAGFAATTRLGIEQVAPTAPPSPPFGGRERRLSAALTEQLRELARQAHVTLGVVIQAAWSVLLARYGGERDVVFGATVSGRPASLAGVEAMVGLFIATVPVRESPSPGILTRQYLVDVQARQVAREPHLHAPLVDIKAWSELPAAASLFDTLVVVENYPASPPADADRSPMTVGALRAIERTHYPLSLFVSPGERLELSASYDRARYADASIESLLGHLENLLLGMADNPDAPLSRLSLLAPAERQALLDGCNQTDDERDEPLVHLAIAAQAARRPEAIAVACDGQTLSYGELMRRVTSLAARLAARGVAGEVIVGLYLERSLDLVVALLAVLQAGGAYLPLDTELPSERIGFMLGDSGARWVLTQTSLLSRLPASAAGVLCVDGGDERGCVGDGTPEPASEPAAPAPGPLGAAYVLYTSGSTGRPKGVTVSHGALRNFLHSMRDAPGIRSDDVLLAVTTISFDIAGLELLLPLGAGARVELLPARAARDGSQIALALRASGATLMQATPSTWRLLLEQDWSGCRLEHALCGGEALPRALADRILARGVTLWNLYGPTETTIWSTLQRVERAEGASVAPDATCRIGQPIANTRVYVLDGDLSPVPAGIAGELFIGGAGVARGYLGRAALTAERFLPDPFGAHPGARLYRTGDRVRFDESGALEFLGRLDHQIKLRGHRIELGEIEAVLLAHQRVGNAVVGLRGVGEDAELSAYLVVRDGPEPSASELRAWLAERLPPYMTISRYVWLAALPLTANGKVDRARLPHAARAPEAEPVAARTATELRLAQIWREVLGTDAIGVEDDFFHVGGHSLKATRVVAQIRAVFQVLLPLAYFFDHPSIVELATEIDQKLAARAAPSESAREDEEELSL